ncbi:MAG: hypothetical protein ABSA11_09245 [Candidatus Bathyarchaeia archaeon]|jgi:predicted RNA-binding Zn-ribbon protein involved in translation (DUF1610 family)
MKTAQVETLQCLSCGSPLRRIEGSDSYRCKKCGEVFDLRGFSNMELDLDEFDRLLLYTLRKGRTRESK